MLRYDGSTAKATLPAAAGDELAATSVDFEFRIYVTPPDPSFWTIRRGTFSLWASSPSTLTLNTTTTGAVTINSSAIPCTSLTSWPSQGSGWITSGSTVRGFRYTGISTNTLTGVTWGAVALGADNIPASFSSGAVIRPWLDISAYCGGDGAISSDASLSRGTVRWSTSFRMDPWLADRVFERCFVVITRATSADSWTHRVFRVGTVRVINGRDDYRKQKSVSITIGGVIDQLSANATPPIVAGKPDIALGTTPSVSSTLNNPSLEAGKGLYAGVVPTVDAVNATDGNAYSAWVAQVAPTPEPETPNVANGLGQIRIDELYIPPVGFGDDYKWFAVHLAHPHGGNGDWFLIANQDTEFSGTPFASYPTGFEWQENYRLIATKEENLKIPAGGRVIFCKNLSAFNSIFDAGGAILQELPAWWNIPSTNGILNVFFEEVGISGAGLGLVYGSPSADYSAMWSGDTIPNPTPGHSVRRKPMGTGGNDNTNWVDEPFPDPGSPRSKSTCEWMTIPIPAWVHTAHENISSGSTNPIPIAGPGGELDTTPLSPNGHIQFAGSTEVIAYTSNDGRYLRGITRGALGTTPSASTITAGTQVYQYVVDTATNAHEISGCKIIAPAGGPVYGTVGVYTSKVGISNPRTPNPANVTDPEEMAWQSDWDTVFHGTINAYATPDITFSPRRVARVMIVIFSMRQRLYLVNPSAALSDTVYCFGTGVPTSPSSFETRGGRWSYTGASRQGEYIVLTGVTEVTPPPNTLDDSMALAAGYERPRVASFQVYQSSATVNQSVVASADVAGFVQYVIEKVGGDPGQVKSVDLPVQVNSIGTAAGRAGDILGAFLSERGLILIEWPDGTLEISIAPFWDNSGRYTESLYTFSDATLISPARTVEVRDAVSQVVLTSYDPVTETETVTRYPSTPLPTGAVLRQKGIITKYPNLAARAIFKEANGGTTLRLAPAGLCDWVWPGTRVNATWGMDSGEFVSSHRLWISKVSQTWSFGNRKGYYCQVEGPGV